MAMPTEIWTHVFSFLLDPSDLWSSVRALIHVGNVCRYWCVSPVARTVLGNGT